MKIAVCGYMGSGKSTVSQLLAEKLKLDFIELDKEIQKKENFSISEIFAQKGEIYFRKKETLVLEETLSNIKKAIISLGGGTPCYGNNLELLKNDEELKLVYLKVTPQNLTQRLYKERAKRPLIANLEKEKLEEYVRKHLFERQFYYLQSDVIIDANNKTVEDLVAEISKLLD